MPRNILRQLVKSDTYSSLRVNYFSTESVSVECINAKAHEKSLLTITKINNLQEADYFSKFLQIILDPAVEGFIRNGEARSGPHREMSSIVIELSSKLARGVKQIIAGEYSNLDKFIFIVGYTKLNIELSQKALANVLENRIDPLKQLTHFRKENLSLRIANNRLVLNVFYTNFLKPESLTPSTESEYVKYCLTSRFVAHEEPASTFKEFLAKHSEDFFRPVTVVQNATVMRHVNRALVEDYTPAEYARFMTYFNIDVSRELRGWVKRRFDAGVKPLRELRARGEAVNLEEASIFNYYWRSAIDFMTAEEAAAFLVYLEQTKGISSRFVGCDSEAGSLVAYYWVEGGPERLNELANHALRNQIDHKADPHSTVSKSLSGQWVKTQRFGLYWRNEYSSSSSKKLNLLPYVKVLQNADADEIPLEWLLAAG